MSAKVTLRLPEHVLERLRERSRTEGRSLNDTVIATLPAGLGETATDQVWRDLGDLVAAPPERPYDPAELGRLRDAVRLSPDGFMEAGCAGITDMAASKISGRGRFQRVVDSVPLSSRRFHTNLPRHAVGWSI